MGVIATFSSRSPWYCVGRLNVRPTPGLAFLSLEIVAGTCRWSLSPALLAGTMHHYGIACALTLCVLWPAVACRGLRRHASDWLPTWVIGVAGQNPSVATGPRPLDGHNLWDAWTGPNATSPRTEIIHQVVNKYTDADCHNGSLGLPPMCAVAPFANTIRVGRFKLIQGAGKPSLEPFFIAIKTIKYQDRLGTTSGS